MHKIYNEDWLKINSLLLRIYSTQQSNILDDVISGLRSIIPFSHSLACYQKPNYSPGDPEIMKSQDIPEEYLHLYSKKYSKLDFINWYVDSSYDSVFRESDVLYDEIRSKSVFAKEWLTPLDIFYGACMIISDKYRKYGTVFLYRSKDENDFSDKEIQILKIINEHLCLRFSQYAKTNSLQIFTITNNLNPYIETLTNKEKELIYIIKNGVLRDDLCEILGISKNTLNKHLDSMYKKLNIHTYEELLHLVHQKSNI